jgi:hypothetical protein
MEVDLITIGIEHEASKDTDCTMAVMAGKIIAGIAFFPNLATETHFISLSIRNRNKSRKYWGGGSGR